MSARYLRIHQVQADPIPWIKYTFAVGGVLIGLMFVADAYLPKPEPRSQHDIDRTVLRVHGPNQQASLAPMSLAQADNSGRATR